MTSPLDRTISVSFFKNVRATVPEVRQLPLRSLDEFVRKTFTASTPDLKKAREVLPLFKPGTFKSGRKAEDLASIDCIEGDYDAGRDGLDWALARLIDAGIAAYIHTTSRHSDVRPRFRIYCPLSRSMPPSAWEKQFSFLNEVLGNSLDPNAAQVAQGYFVGRLDICEEPEIYHVDGNGCDYIDLALVRHLGARNIRDGDIATITPRCLDEDPFGGLEGHSEEQISKIRAMLSVLSADDYGTWVRVGLILHHELGAAGFEIWDEWSATSQRYGGTEAKWRTFSRPGNRKPIGLGSLRKMALGPGWSDPEADPDIRRMNEAHALVMVRGKALVATFDTDGTVTFGQLKDLHAFYENVRVPVSDSRTEPVSRKWARHPDRRTYAKGVTFAPGRSSLGKLNLWTGWKVAPDPQASCELYLEHIRNVVCAGDRKLERYVLGWLAHLVQQPREIPGVALILRGGKGVGKDTFVEYLVRLIGRQHVPTVSQSEHVTGRFNSRLEAALVLHIQEGFWGGDRKAEQVLKYLITSGDIEIERKGVDAFSVESCLRLIMTGNADWMIPASADERRFAVLDVSSCRQGDAEYFNALQSEMKKHGPAALMHYLLNYDLGNFDVRKPPATKGLLDQKLRSLRGVEKWWFECLAAGEIVPTTSHSSLVDADLDWGSGHISIAKSEVRNRYSSYIRTMRHQGDPLDDVVFSKELKKVLPGFKTVRPSVDGVRQWQFVFPALEACREQFAAKHGHEIDWPD